MATQMWGPPACVFGGDGGSSKEQWPWSACLSGESCPSALSPQPTARRLSSSPCVSLVPCEMLPHRWSAEGGSLSGEFMNSWDSRSPLSPSATVPTGFHTQKLGGLLFLPLEPWAGCGPQCGAGTPCSSGDLCSRDVPPDFYPPHVGVGPARPVCLSLLLGCVCTSLVVGCPFSWISGSAGSWLFCRLVAQEF